jgi:thiol-disulfide isomerase/thioredoxin
MPSGDFVFIMPTRRDLMTRQRQNRQARRSLSVVVVVAAAILVVWAWYNLANGIRLSSPDDSPEATALYLVDPQGGGVPIDSFRGKVVVLNLWASWCPPCRTEVPRLNRLAATSGDELVVLGVNVEGLDAARLARVQEELGIGYRVVVPGGAFDGTFAWNGLLPYIWLIDKQGRVRAAHGGLPIERSLRRACEKLRREAG